MHVCAFVGKLVDLHIAMGDYGTCISMLQQCLQNHNHDFLHTKLADVYTLHEQFAEALTCYHTAISLNPASTAAAQGLERLEKLMRGVDPDLAEEEADADTDGAEVDASLDGTEPPGFDV